MSELEKMEAGLEYNFMDEAIAARKEHAVVLCKAFNNLDPLDYEAQERAIRELLGTVGDNAGIQQGFHCDYGKNIHLGSNITVNYNVTILDIAPVSIGDYCMIGPNTLISTVNHPMNAEGRRKKLGQAKPVVIGNDVWIGGNCTILPGVTIGNNVVVAAGAVVTKDVPDDSLAGGVPARVIKMLERS